jgi:serine phosphatase RsbU (regulator of sigma subunit)
LTAGEEGLYQPQDRCHERRYAYIFTDGYADQFGGDEDKKFKTINIRRLLSELYNYPEDEQKRLLEKAIRDWMGDLPQIDDILFVGTRIP